MRNSLKIYEQIDNYLSNNLSEADRITFEKEIEIDPDLKELVGNQQLLIQAQKRKVLRSEIETIAKGGGFPIGKVLSFVGVVLVSTAIYLFSGNEPVEPQKNISENKVEVVTKEVVSNNYTEGSVDFAPDSVDTTNNVAAIPTAKNKSYTYEEDTECGGHKTWVEPDRQKFTIDPSKGKTIEGKEGLLIIVPTDAFIDDFGNIVKKPVELELVEALTLEDMVLYDLATLSDGKTLESGGMFYIDPKVNGKSVKINPDRPLYIEVPTNEVKEGMMAFKGEVNEEGDLNWVEPKPLNKFLVKLDLDNLDFLPNGFAEAVEDGIPFRNHKKTTNKLVDSLYYSLANIGEMNENIIVAPEVFESEAGFIDSKLPKGNGSVQGQLRYTNGKGISNAIVYLGNINGSTFVRPNATTGEYSFSKMPPGKFRLNVALEEVVAGGESKYEVVYSADVNIIKGELLTVDKIVLEDKSKTSNTNLLLSDNSSIFLEKLNREGENCGINPLSLKTIRTDNFADTYVATKEFEDRIRVLHNLEKGQELLDVYLNNLGLDMYIADSIVMERVQPEYKSEFEKFYLLKLTNIKDAEIHQKQLSAYYKRKRKEFEVSERKLRIKLMKKDRKEIQTLVKQVEAAKKQFRKTLRANASPATRYAKMTETPNVATSQSYGMSWAAIGWCNIDTYNRLYSQGSMDVDIRIENSDRNTQIYQWLNAVNSLIPLTINNGDAVAKFPLKRGGYSDKMRNTYCFAISKNDGVYKWSQNNFDAYYTSNVTASLQTVSLDQIKHNLNLLDVNNDRVMASFNRFENTIKKVEKQLEKRKKIVEEIEMSKKNYLSKSKELENKIDEINQRRIEENIFINSLKEVAFSCKCKEVEYSSNETDLEIEEVSEIFTTVDVMPQYALGKETIYDFVGRTIVYPEIAYKDGIEGTVYTQFIVSSTGKVSNAVITKGVDNLLDTEALRVVNSLPDFIPGKQRGQNVNVYFTLPIRFQLD